MRNAMEVWTKMNRISSEKFCIRDNCFNVQQYSNLQNKKSLIWQTKLDSFLISDKQFLLFNKNRLFGNHSTFADKQGVFWI